MAVMAVATTMDKFQGGQQVQSLQRNFNQFFKIKSNFKSFLFDNVLNERQIKASTLQNSLDYDLFVTKQLHELGK